MWHKSPSIKTVLHIHCLSYGNDSSLEVDPISRYTLGGEDAKAQRTNYLVD